MAALSLHLKRRKHGNPCFDDKVLILLELFSVLLRCTIQSSLAPSFVRQTTHFHSIPLYPSGCCNQRTNERDGKVSWSLFNKLVGGGRRDSTYLTLLLIAFRCRTYLEGLFVVQTKTLTHNTIQGQDEFEWSSCCVLSRKPQKSVNFLHVLRHARPTKSFICCVGQRRVRWIRPDCCYWPWMPWTHSCVECSVQREQEVWIHDQELISAMVRNINSLSARSQTYWEQEHRHPIPRSSQHHTWWRKIIARDFIYLE